ncbi:hypothetical protein [Streptomyces sp. NPDC048350]|uniref:hypothetical protein n=1 Tax=Streptomyces sp. NPDC048350 TaxID=3365538 RepID=UPI00371485BC
MTTTGPLIRLARPEDASALVALQQTLDGESEFMLLEPGERDPDSGPVEARLAGCADGRDPSCLVVALAGPVVVGYVDVTCCPMPGPAASAMWWPGCARIIAAGAWAGP